ncbi:MAG: hypothetical protein QOD06_27 [Candidatus Binatota bacterium]|jgi:hypothetical protein|nr:hypothetical protein [Candidatus Binatota bacterium]
MNPPKNPPPRRRGQTATGHAERARSNGNGNGAARNGYESLKEWLRLIQRVAERERLNEILAWIHPDLPHDVRVRLATDRPDLDGHFVEMTIAGALVAPILFDGADDVAGADAVHRIRRRLLGIVERQRAESADAGKRRRRRRMTPLRLIVSRFHPPPPLHSPA